LSLENLGRLRDRSRSRSQSITRAIKKIVRKTDKDDRSAGRSVSRTVSSKSTNSRRTNSKAPKSPKGVETSQRSHRSSDSGEASLDRIFGKVTADNDSPKKKKKKNKRESDLSMSMNYDAYRRKMKNKSFDDDSFPDLRGVDKKKKKKKKKSRDSTGRASIESKDLSCYTTDDFRSPASKSKKKKKIKYEPSPSKQRRNSKKMAAMPIDLDEYEVDEDMTAKEKKKLMRKMKVQSASSSDDHYDSSEDSEFDEIPEDAEFGESSDSEQSSQSPQHEPRNAQSREIEDRHIEEYDISLDEALRQIMDLEEKLGDEEMESRRVRAELSDMKVDLKALQEEKRDLGELLEEVEKENITKTRHIGSLEQTVETQRDQVEFLEDKLVQTEKELDELENEVRKIDDGGSFSRKSEDGHKEESSTYEVRERMEKLDAFETELKERERQLDVKREEENLKQVRLSKWELDLSEREEQFKASSRHPGGNELDDIRKELEEKENMLRIEREALNREKAELAESKRKTDGEMLANSTHTSYTSDDKDNEIAKLRAACDKLLNEKLELIRRQKEEDIQRDEDLRLIQEDINVRLKSYQDENRDIRVQLEGAREMASRAEELKGAIEVLERENMTLRETASTSNEGDHDAAVRHLQEEITEQLTELDEENQKLTDQLLTEQKTFKERMKEKDEMIISLEEMLEEIQTSLVNVNVERQTLNLSQDRDDMEKGNTSVARIEEDLAEARACLKAKELQVEELEESIREMKKKTADDSLSKDFLAKDSRIRQLEDELAASKQTVESLSSGTYVEKLKEEVRFLMEAPKELKKRLKKEEKQAESKLKKKDDTIQFMQSEMVKMKKELTRIVKREQRREASKEKREEGSLEEQMDDLENEIEHWRAVNDELEDENTALKAEVAASKAEVIEWKEKANEAVKMEGKGKRPGDDDISEGSHESLTSEISKMRDFINFSEHSIDLSVLSKDDLFYISNASSEVDTNGNPDNNGEETSTPSQRALRSVTGLWTKMKGPQPGQPNTDPYAIALDD